MTGLLTFTRQFNGTPEKWTWRINITDIAVPDDVIDFGNSSANFSQGLHVSNIQRQLGWPGEDESLQQLVKRRNVTMYFNTIIKSLPSNITRKYNDTGDGDCAPILGPSCALYLANVVGPSMSLSQVQGCASTLDVQSGELDFGVGFGKLL